MEKMYFVRYATREPDGRAETQRSTLMVTTLGSKLSPTQQAAAMVAKLHPGLKARLINVLDTNNTCYDYNGRQQHINLFRNQHDTFDVDKWLDDAETFDVGADYARTQRGEPSTFDEPSRPHGKDDDGLPLFMHGE